MSCGHCGAKKRGKGQDCKEVEEIQEIVAVSLRSREGR